MKSLRLWFPLPALLLAISVLLSGCGGSSQRPGPAGPPSSNQLRVACVGDSITFGAGTTNPAIYSYPTVLARRLNSPYEVRNFGVSGSTAMKQTGLPYNVQAAYQVALAFKPHIVVIALGTNDAAQPSAAISSRFVPDYVAIVNSFKAANSSVKVFVCRPIAFSPTSAGAKLESEIMPKIPTIASQTGATIIDLYAPTRDKPNYYSDTLHPNNAGAAAIADTVFDALKASGA